MHCITLFYFILFYFIFLSSINFINKGTWNFKQEAKILACSRANLSQKTKGVE